ncbi:STAG domain-containing protein [Gorgonomyces haynaldii]|nr:STAG domain-containing protein [Gorgonomyces haynaldii]
MGFGLDSICRDLPSKMSDRTPTKRRRTVDAQRIGLFDAMLQGSSLKQLILDWTSDYQKDKVEAMAQLINLCVQASGCPSTVDTSQVEDSDNYSDTLEELQTYFEPQSQHQYPIASKKGDYAKFRKIFVDFWTKFVDSMRSNALYDDDNYCFETLVSWLGTMSSSTFRPFRHTGTLAALALQTQLSKTCQMTHDEALGYTKQLSGAKGTRKANLEERLEEAQAKTIRTRDLVKSLFDIIFVHRYRDIDPVIRADCIKELGKCVLYCSHLFLDTQHVRYLGWMLSDKSSQVRMEALKSISKLFEQDEFFDSLGPIAERFKPRIIDMATMEKENNIRHEAIKALCLMSDAGFLDEEDEEKMMPILAHNDQKARDLVAPAIVSMYKTLAARMEDEESYESFGSLKAYCQVMTKLSQLVEEKEEEEEKESQTMVLSDASFTPVLLEMQSQAKIDCTDLLDWIASQDFHDASPIGYNLVSLAAASLSNHIDLDPQQIGDYLTRDVDEPIFQLNQQEECILLYTMSYCTTKEMDDDKKAEASAVLIKVLPLLLSKYAVDLEHLPKLIETLEMAKKLDVQAFVDLQEMEALDALCQQIITLLNKSFNKRVVELGLETLYGLTDTASGTVQDAVPTFVENVVLEWKQAMKHAQQTFEEQGVLDTEPFERLGKWMQLMQYLVNHERFYEHCKIMTFEQIDGIYDISKICLDYGLDLLQRNLSEDGRSNLINTSTDIVQASLHIMMINLLYRLKDMVDLASLVEHSQTLVNFCQGIVSASGQSDLQLPIPIKIVALRMLSGLFPLLNGNVVEQYPQLQHHIAEPAQESCINLLSYVIELLAVHAPLLKTKASFSTVHYNLLETVNIFWNLSLNGQMTIGAASGLAQWFSVEDVSIVGPTHNCIISNGIQKCFSKVMEQPDQHLHMIQHLPFFVQKTIENVHLLILVYAPVLYWIHLSAVTRRAL